MEYFSLLELPEDIKALVFERVSRNSILDLFCVRESSKWMKALADRRRVYNFFDVLSVPWDLDMPSQFLKTCYEEGNPSTIYLKGAQFFFYWCFKEEGFYLLKQAADAGYERAVYLHAITRVIFWSDGEYMSRIPRESVARMGKLVRSVKWGGGLWHCNEFREKKEAFESSYLPWFYNCKCGNLIERAWNCLWQIDVSKDDSMYNRCFYIKELGCFFRDFLPVTLFRDTSRW
ncbi:hypothetical protein Bca52824_033916 [Brassica carinata]|uniref:At2g35280-like TPR domain-containing protein n=1 Tax=Brassica carinata TaxID=52824 RepID=A0A8X7V6I8_BRACI|nr:hypothetical protein Bca52824_033916 [Brassica carinata]